MSFSIINTFNPFTHSVQAVNYAPNGLYVVAGGPSNDPAYVFEYNTGNIISQYSNFSSFCYDLRFSPDGDYVLGASQEVFIFEAATGNEYFWLDAGSVLSADWSPDGTKFAFPDNTNNLVRVYDFVTKTELFTLSQEKPDRVRFSPDGNYLAVGSD